MYTLWQQRISPSLSPAFGHLYRIIPEILSTPQARDLVSFRRERASTIKKVFVCGGIGTGTSINDWFLFSNAGQMYHLFIF